jgi:hypothetical protein
MSMIRCLRRASSASMISPRAPQAWQRIAAGSRNMKPRQRGQTISPGSMIGPPRGNSSRVASRKQPRRSAIAKSKPKDTRRRTPPLEKAAARLEAARIAVEVVNPATRDAPRFRQLERRLALSRTDFTDDGQILAGVTPLSETASPPRYSVRIDWRVPTDEILASLDRLLIRNARRWTKVRAARPGYRPEPAEYQRRILSFDPLSARTALRRDLRTLVQASAPRRRQSRFRPIESDRYHRAVAYIAGLRRDGKSDPTRQQLARQLGCSQDKARRALEHAHRLLQGPAPKKLDQF